jgi:hypothetical protein
MFPGRSCDQSGKSCKRNVCHGIISETGYNSKGTSVLDYLQISASKATVRTTINKRAFSRENVIDPEVIFDIVHIAAIGSSVDDEGLVACPARRRIVRENRPDETDRKFCPCISGGN